MISSQFLVKHRGKILSNIQWDIIWEFPAEYVHNGMPLANGISGALIYGAENILKVNINRSDFWDHRGGLKWNEDMTFKSIKNHVDAKNQKKLKDIFYANKVKEGDPKRLPMGRFELVFDKEVKIINGMLNIKNAEAVININKKGTISSIVFSMIKDIPGLAYRADQNLKFSVKAVPADLQESDYRTDEYCEGKYTGWSQKLPEDPSVAVLNYNYVFKESNEGLIAACYGQCQKDAIGNTQHIIIKHASMGYTKATKQMRDFWNKFWKRSAIILINNKKVQRLYYLGIYKMASISMPGGPAATLQGPWVEDFRIPPWSGDYHFDINVQQCYWPAYATNHLQILKPLFEMIERWKPKLKEYACRHTGIKDGFMLPVAVDDRCTMMNTMFSVDHSNTVWVGYHLWLYYKYTLDETFLKEAVYPFLRAAFKVYKQMLILNNDKYHLPSSISAEYSPDNVIWWGKNASVHLAAIHFLCKSIIKISEKIDICDRVVGECRDVQNKLPRFAKGKGKYGDEIFIWEGIPLEKSHRHFSNLAGIYPYDILNYMNDIDRNIIDNSIRTWFEKGISDWWQFSYPWAMILLTRVGRGDIVELLMEIYSRVFFMKGYAGTCNNLFSNLMIDKKSSFFYPPIMQLEASISISLSILEMLVYTSNDILHLLPVKNIYTRDASFSCIRIEGAFLIDGEIKDGEVLWIRIRSLKGQNFTLLNPFKNSIRINYLNRDRTLLYKEQKIIEIQTEINDTIEIKRG